jgi:hypothetical protein
MEATGTDDDREDLLQGRKLKNKSKVLREAMAFGVGFLGRGLKAINLVEVWHVLVDMALSSALNHIGDHSSVRVICSC